MSTRTTTRPAVLDLTVISQLLTDPDLFAETLPGESAEERRARRGAAADITDDLINASITRDGIDHVAALAARQTEVIASEAEAKVARWLDDIRGAAA